MEFETGKPPIQNGPEAFARRILEGTRRHYHDAKDGKGKDGEYR